MAGPLDLRGRVTILDAGATQTLKRIGGAMSAVSQKARAATSYVGNVGDSANRGGRRFSSRMGGITGSGIGTFAAAAGGAAFIRNEFEYQSAMNRTQAVLNITDDKMYNLNGKMVDGATYFKQHSNLVVDLAKKYPATSAEIAKGASELAMAGMSMGQVNEVLEATIQGSMASGESIKTVGMGVTDVLLGLGKALTKSNYQELNNVMAAASTSFSQDYSQFLAGYAKTAPMARMLNMDMRQLAGTLGILADAGYKAEKGGTALRSSMIYAAAPGKTAVAQMNRYLKKQGLQYSDFKRKADSFQLGGPEGAKALSSLLSDDLGVGTDGLDRVLEPILNDPKNIKNPTRLKRQLVQSITSALGVDDPMNAEKVAQSVSSFVESGFQQLDFVGLLRKLHEVGFDRDIEAMKELFKMRFVAPMGALMQSLEPGGAFDQKMELFLPRIQDAVKRFADILMKGLPGALKRLGGAFDGLLRAMASSGAIDTVVWALEKLRDGLNWLSQFSPTTLKGLTIALLGLAVLAPIGMALSAVGAGIGVIATALATAGGLAVGVTRFARSLFLLGAAGKAAGKVKWLFGAGGAAATSGGAAAAVGGSALTGGLLAKMLKGGGKLLGRAVLPLMLGMALYDGYQGYQKNGWKGAFLNALTLGFADGTGNDGAAESGVRVGEPHVVGMGGEPSGQTTASQLAQIEAQAQQSAARVRDAMNLDLTAEGLRAGQSFASGLAQGMQSAVENARNAAAQIRSAAGGVQLNTGPSMRGAN